MSDGANMSRAIPIPGKNCLSAGGGSLYARPIVEIYVHPPASCSWWLYLVINEPVGRQPHQDARV